MSNPHLPEYLDVPLPAMISLAIEQWRLSRFLAAMPASAANAPARHAARKIEDFLKLCELEARSLDGSPFDPGMAARVVDTVEDPAMGDKRIVEETLSPQVLWRGQLLRAAEIVVRQGAAEGNHG